MERFIDLPMDLVVEILSWLPAESLLRSKCVCKQWCALIKDGAFAAKHLRNLNKISPNKSLVFVNYGWRTYTRPEKSFLTVSEDGDGECIEFVIEDSMLPLFRQYKEYARPFLGCHCNGILCLYSCVSKNILLCNPTTKECKFLPDSSSVDDFCTVMVGFGCANNDVYKVVRVFTRRNISFRAEVCTLGGSSWREIEVNVLQSEQETFQLLFASLKNTFKEQFCRGVYYWLFSLSSEKEMMISFDVCKEEFHRIPLPDYSENAGYSISSSLQVWDDSLALFYHSRCIYTMGSIEMWVMRESTDGLTSSCSHSWTKHLTFGPFEGIGCPLAFWRSDELLMRAKDEGLVSYNLSTRKLKSVSTPMSPVDLAHTYVKSLVSVHGSN